LVSLSLSGHLNFLDPNNPSKPRLIVKGHNKFINSLAVDSKRNKVYTGAYDSQIVAWDITTGTNETFEGRGHTNQVNSLTVAGDLLASSGKDDTARFTNANGHSYGPDFVKLDGEGTAISANADGSLAVVSSVNSVHLLRGQKNVGNVATPYGSRGVSLSPSGTEVAVAGADNHVYVYSVSGNSLTQTHKIEGHRGPLTTVAYSPDGKHLASADTNREIIVWDAASKQLKVNGWVFHTARVNSIAWSPDNVHLASGGLDQNLFIWNVSAPTTRIQIKNAHHGGVNGVAWVNANTLASTGQDCALRTHSIKY